MKHAQTVAFQSKGNPLATFLTLLQAAEYLGRSPKTIYKMVHERRIPYYKPAGGKLLFDPYELEAFVRASRVSTNVEIEKAAEVILNTPKKQRIKV